MRKFTTWGMVLLLLLGFSACSRDSEEEPIGNEDLLEAGPLSLVEKNMSAQVVGDSLEVFFPLTNAGQGKLSGKVEITCRHLAGEWDATGEGSFVLEPGDDTVVAHLDGVPPFESSGEQAEYVVEYRVRAGSYEVKGKRSLFMLIPKQDLILVLPNKLQEGQVSQLRAFLMDPRNGTALGGKQVELELSKDGEVRKTLKEKTDDNGVAIFEVEGDEIGSLTLKAGVFVEDGEDGEKVEAEVQVVRESKLLLTTDKPMYQPGQTMHIRSLALNRFDLAPEAGEELLLEVLDSKGNKVFKRLAETNEFGIGWAQFTLATQVLLGSYTVRATMGDVVSEKTVTVDRYSLPKFKVDVQVDKGYYMAGQKVLGEIQVDYFFGKPVSGGDVHITAYKYEAEWAPMVEVEGKTNDNGFYPFEVQLPDYLVGQPLENGNAMVLMEVVVTDTASHEQKVAKNLIIASAAMDILVIPESGDVVPEIPNVFYIFVADPNGQPVGATCTLTVNGAELEGEDDEVVIPPMGPGKVTLIPHQGSLEFSVTAENDDGDTAMKNFNFSVGAGEAAVLVRTDRAIYKVGESLQVDVFATGGHNHLFMDIVRKNQTVLTKTVALVDGHAQVIVDLDEMLTEDIAIDVYMLADSGQFIRDTAIVYVQPARDLVVEMTTDKDEYLPGETAVVGFEVKDKENNPVVSALGIQVVDEAVFALSEIKPGLLKLYFQLEEELSSPTYQIGVGTGWTFGSLLTASNEAAAGSEEDGAIQDTTKATLAAMETPSLGQSASSSWKEALAEMAQVLSVHFTTQKEEIRNHLEAILSTRNEEWDNACNFLMSYLEQPRFYDYWGNAYTFTVSGDWWDCGIEFASRGPDELTDTADDWSGSLNLYDLSGENWKGGDRGWPMAGGMEDGEMAFDQNGAGPPHEPDPTSTDDDGSGGGDKSGIKVRSWFPETLFVEPSLITDSSGVASVEILLADSITEWRMTTLASSQGGQLGSRMDGIVVFQDFFVDIDFPKYLTQNDEISFPIAVYNYLPLPQTVTIEVMEDEWFDLVDGTNTRILDLAPGEVAGVFFPVKVTKVGWHSLTVYGIGENEAKDAIKRTVEVKPDGKEMVVTDSARFDNDGENVSTDLVTNQVVFPSNAIEGSQSLVVKVLPGLSSHVVEGMESMLKLPGG